MAGTTELSAGVGNLIVDITDANGSVLRQLQLGPQTPGIVRFGWDGMTESGEAAPVGLYSVNVYSELGGEARPYAVNLPNRVIGGQPWEPKA